jgi:hypothetical protein
MYFFLNLEVIQLKLLKDLAHISLPAMGMICFADADKQRTKNKRKKTFTCFFANTACTAANCCDVTYNDKD